MKFPSRERLLDKIKECIADLASDEGCSVSQISFIGEACGCVGVAQMFIGDFEDESLICFI